jgi:hypothetical protein
MVGVFGSGYPAATSPAFTLQYRVKVGSQLRLRLSADAAGQCGNPALSLLSPQAPPIVLAWTCGNVCLGTLCIPCPLTAARTNARISFTPEGVTAVIGTCAPLTLAATTPGGSRTLGLTTAATTASHGITFRRLTIERGASPMVVTNSAVVEPSRSLVVCSFPAVNLGVLGEAMPVAFAYSQNGQNYVGLEQGQGALMLSAPVLDVASPTVVRSVGEVWPAWGT